MPHGISQAVKDHLSTNGFQLATLVEFGTEPVIRFTDFGANLVAFNNLFTPSDYFLEVGDVTETSALQVGSFKLVMSGVNSVYTNLALSGDYLGKSVSIWRAVISGGQVVGLPWSMFIGRMTGFSISEKGKDSKVSFDIASHWSDFEKVNCRRTNGNSQRRFFPNDSGLNFSAKTMKNQKWGRV